MAKEPEGVAIPVVWVGGDEAPILLANQGRGCELPDGQEHLIVLELTDELLGTEDERRAQAQELSFIPVKVLARFALTRSRLEELVRVLQETLENHDKHREQGRGAFRGSGRRIAL
jgi:hypothetical protein